jgi:plasmid stability protein
MSKMIQIRNVPDDLHRRLKSRAVLAGMSLSDFLLSEVRQALDKPSLAELRDRLSHRSAYQPAIPVAQAVREERENKA